MIELFEEQTQPLTDKELEMLPTFIKWLSEKVGRHNAVTNGQIVQKMIAAHDFRLDGARVRKIINQIRLNGWIPGLMASSDGYYIATSESEFDEWIESLGHRITSIAAIKRSAETQRALMFPKNEPSLFNTH